MVALCSGTETHCQNCHHGERCKRDACIPSRIYPRCYRQWCECCDIHDAHSNGNFSVAVPLMVEMLASMRLMRNFPSRRITHHPSHEGNGAIGEKYGEQNHPAPRRDASGLHRCECEQGNHHAEEITTRITQEDFGTSDIPWEESDSGCNQHGAQQETHAVAGCPCEQPRRSRNKDGFACCESVQSIHKVCVVDDPDHRQDKEDLLCVSPLPNETKDVDFFNAAEPGDCPHDRNGMKDQAGFGFDAALGNVIKQA